MIFYAVVSNSLFYRFLPFLRRLCTIHQRLVSSILLTTVVNVIAFPLKRYISISGKKKKKMTEISLNVCDASAPVITKFSLLMSHYLSLRSFRTQKTSQAILFLEQLLITKGNTAR